MKTFLKLLTRAGLILGTASIVLAGPPSTFFQTLRQEEQFRQLKPGDKVVYVCNQCKTVTEQTIATAGQAMEQCKEGATVTCPACKAKVKVTVKGPPKNRSMQREVIYTNDQGEECLFVAKVMEKK